MKSMRRFGLWLVALLALWSVNVSAQESLCAVVKIEISQELTLERQAFEANMRISNSLDTLALESVRIDILFEDSDGNPVVASSDPNHDSARFFVNLDDYTGINSVVPGDNGAVQDGKIDPAQAAELRWLIVPTAGAGGDDGAGRLYYVGAKLSFTYGGESQTIEVAPDTIVVKPQPNLTLDYFLPSEVNGDNPFTPEIEPIEPYNLGVRLSNKGSGPAHAVKIQSAQPKIVENEHGLLVDFRIVGSFINDAPANKTLLLDFGDIAAKSNTSGRWVMETSLTGRFTEFDATFTHVDEFGGALTSLIEAVNTHFLLRDVVVDLPGRDSVKDFLAQDASNVRVYESEKTGTDLADCTDCLAVSSLAGTLGSATSSAGATQRTLTTTATSGPVHIKIADPYQGEQALTNVVRSDGKVLSPANYWLSKTIQEDKIHYDYFLNVFDTSGGSAYTLTFGGQSQVNEPPVLQHIANYTTYETGQVGFLVQASDPNKTVPTLTAANLPAGATFQDEGNGQGVFNWFPKEGQAGTYTPEFTASDGELTALRSTSVRVFPSDDQDGDGMSDAWEIEHFGDLSRDGTGDFDGDGILDKDEFLRDSDPTVAEQAPAAPQLNSPAYGAEVTSRTPTLRITNGDNSNIGLVDYTFEVYENESMTQQLARVESVQEGVDTTEIVLDSSVLPGSALKDNTHYYWRVNARTAAGASEWVNGRFFVNTVNDSPTAFTLSKPSDETLVDTLTPTLVTNNSADIDGDTLAYSFQVFAEDDASFSSPVAEVSGLAQGGQGQTAWTVSTPLVNGQLYFWIATATDEHGAVTVADPASFIVSTSNLAPGAPVASSPNPDEVIMGTGVTLVVQNAKDPERQPLEYWFELDEVNTFDSPARQVSGAVTEGSSTTQWAADGLVEGQTYYWRAKADDGSAQGPWVTSSFRMYTDALPPGTPTLDNPADDAWVEVLAPTLSVHPVTDPNGDAVSYEFELYRDEAMAVKEASATVDGLQWELVAPLQNHQTYYWRARAVDEGGLASNWSAPQRFFINKDGYDDPPTLSFVLPDASIDTYGGNIQIQWVDQDPDSSARISLFYNDTHLIVADLSEDSDGEGDKYSWNIDSLPAGTYTLSAVISDASNDVRVEACCTIRKSDREIAAKVTATTEAVTDEAGVTVAAFDVVLESSPRIGSTVLINLSVSDATEGEILDGLTYLEFTPDNWSVPQQVRVRGKDDCDIDGDQGYHLQFAPAISSDPTYDGTLTPAVEIVNRDDELSGQTLFICGYQLLGQTQGAGDQTHYEYLARLRNGGLGINSATASAVSLDNRVSLVSGLPVSFPAAASGESVWSQASFVVAAPTGEQPNTAALAWSIEGQAPQITSTAPIESMEGESYSYQIEATGRPGDVLSFSLAEAPAGMTIDPATGLLQWTPEAGQQGAQQVVVEVRDQFGGVTRQTFTIEVSPDGSVARVIVVDTNPNAQADYHSLAEAVRAQAGTFTRPIVIRARASSGVVDTQAVEVSGFQPSADKPLTLVLEQGYTLDIAGTGNYTRGIFVRVPHVRVQGEGGQIVVRNNGYEYSAGITLDSQVEGSLIVFEGLRVKGIMTGEPKSSTGISASNPNATYVLRNNEVTGFTGSYTNHGMYVNGPAYVYNNTLAGNSYGLRVEAGNAVVYNNLSVNNMKDYTSWQNLWSVTSHNVSSDDSSPDEAYRGREVAFVDGDNDNFALAPWDEAAQGQGLNLSATEHHPFSNDIRQIQRSNPWDAGAHTVGEVSNWPPFIDSTAVVRAEEGQPYLYPVEASDNDGDTLTYQLAKSPSGMTINSGSGAIEWLPSSDQVGEFEVVVEVADGRGGIAQQTFSLVVSPANSGGARLIVVDTNPQAEADYRSLAAAIAGEAGELTQPLLIRARATTGLPETAPVTIHGIGTSAENPLTVVLEEGYKLEVNALDKYARAILIRDAHVRIKGEGGEIAIHNNGYDYVTGILVQQQTEDSVVMLEGLRVKSVITGDPGSATGISASDDNATYVLRNNIVTGFTGSYTNHGLYVKGTAFVYNNTLVGNRYGLRVETGNAVVYNNLSVNNMKDYTSWQNLWSVTSHNISSDASSPDGDYRNRTVAFVDADNGNFALAPWDEVALGKGLDLSATEFYPFATDARQVTRASPWDIGALTVGEVNNWPPFIDSEPVLEAAQKESYHYQVQASDHDGDTLSYELEQAPSGMTIDSDSGVIDWVPASGQHGKFEVLVEVGDGFGGIARQAFNVNVSPAAVSSVMAEKPKIKEWLRKLFRSWFPGFRFFGYG